MQGFRGKMQPLPSRLFACYGYRRRTRVASLRKSVAVSVLFTLFGGPGLLLVLVPWWMTRFRWPEDEPLWQVLGCTALMITGLLPLLESIWRFIVVGRGTLMPAVPPEHLVVSGLYRYVRNPMYVGVFTVIAGEAMLLQSRSLAIELAAVLLGVDLFVRHYEEPKLSRTFGDEYSTYQQNVRRWLPRLTAWRPPGQ
jgi:protein-S-isoprenylcysteine O-methyltransferase Ste14